ncbi:hypothetical protein [Vibrio aestuarianus]|uniref:hypothetical protein n=1 Tax=Vibrio aestuarianus TaxID=28171 RepID=UPI00237C6CAA|nr:hypothetical protein [Vibrio aestuarianus]MDE1337179.1 hypothetical protein [Vibrio aestuarianus]
MEQGKFVVDKGTVFESYSQDPTLRSLFTLIPYLGPIIDAQMTSRASYYQGKRFDAMLRAIHSEINAIERDHLNKAYIESEEFYDLVVNAFTQASRLASEDRIDAIASIIKESLDNGTTQQVLAIDLVSVLGEMSESEASLLGQLGHIYQRYPERLQGDYNHAFRIEAIEAIEDLLTTEIARNSNFLCSRLVSRGVLFVSV